MPSMHIVEDMQLHWCIATITYVLPITRLTQVIPLDVDTHASADTRQAAKQWRTVVASCIVRLQIGLFQVTVVLLQVG